ncbi:probable extracellular repeat, HAF family [Nitrosospira sp. Nsp14]|uniref:hypothetical protein n=1 Tax=Nitrosospira sp. Nsp14 TaxID=1855333 RepID=UPI0008EF71D9|nr:hypothetical protein [Nitrosospira sp. Nsp14]SFH34435.1 probable extracellular repeat, HAF family [Nitrosospira sp. Nsp14]
MRRRKSLWSGTTIIGLRDSFNSQANAINNAGQVVGTVERITGSSHAYLWKGATTRTDLGMLGGNPSCAVAIDNTGQVAGWSETTGPAAPHATLWNGTTRTDLGPLGGIDSRAFAINDAGQVAGWASTTGGAHHAALWNGTRATDLGTLGGSRSEALAINSAGQVAGWASTTGGAQHAILWKGTTATDLNGFLDASIVNAGWMLSVANGINDNGWIVGNAHNSKSGLDHAFLLAPIYTFTDLGTLGGLTATPAPSIMPPSGGVGRYQRCPTRYPVEWHHGDRPRHARWGSQPSPRHQ